MKKQYTIVAALVVVALLAFAGWGLTALASGASPASAQADSVAAAPAVAQVGQTPAPSVASSTNELLAAFEGALESVYNQVNPSVVNIQVTATQSSGSMNQYQQGNPFGMPFQFPNPQPSQGLGSGFVWDTQGHIVTNNHVVDGADQISVTFYDGTQVPATLVAADPDSDLSVIQVDVPAADLVPVQLADSSQVRVGELAVAIGNPFGLEGTMTAGIISALGRSLPVQNQYQRGLGGTYSIPDVIQTDAPINPGNSGGVLLNDGGQVIGVTSAIESTAGSNAGIGFAIPSNIVASVVPSLISSGGYDHPWIGILGTTLTSDLATAMGLPADQRGALVIDVTPGSPAEQAGLQGSNTEVTINGQSTVVGGDVIVAIDGQTVAGMDDLIAYLANNTKVGQTVTLTVLRNGNDMQISLTLGARPTGGTTGTTPQPNATQEPTPEATPQTSPNATPAAGAYLGIVGLSMTPELAQAMNLPSGQQGVLVEQVQNGSPADQAGLRGSYKTATVNGTEVLVGGDIITGIGSKVVTSMEDLRTWLQTATPGRTVALNILRDGVAMQLSVTPGQSPAGTS